MEDLLNTLFYEGPTEFSLDRLSEEDDLFRSRAALFYTPTENIPPQWVGKGNLDVVLPLALPTVFDYADNIAVRIPRLWVDLMQRATGKIRWTPMLPARVRIVRYDSTSYGPFDLSPKALIDALKYKTTGRSDGRLLYYFGAIRDDNHKDLKIGQILQETVSRPSQSRTRLIVEPVPLP